MASNFLKNKAKKQAEKIDKEYGEGTYGSTADLKQKTEASKEKSPSTKSGGAETKKKSKASPFLQKKASQPTGIVTGAKQWAQSATDKVISQRETAQSQFAERVRKNMEDNYGYVFPEGAKNFPLLPIELTPQEKVRIKAQSIIEDSDGADAISSFFHSLGYGGEKFLRGVVDGIEDTGDFLLTLPAAAIYGVSSGFGTWDNPVSNWAEGAYNQINNDDVVNYMGSAEERWDKAPDWVHEWGWLPEGIGNLVPTLAAAYFSGGTSTAVPGATGASMLGTTSLGKLAPFASDIVLGTGAAGSAAETAIEKGANPVESALYGTGSGLTEIASERLFSGIAGTGWGKSVVNFTTKIPVLNFALSRLGEGVEEGIVTGADPVLQRVTGVDPNAEWATWNDYVESGSHGVILSLVLGVATSKVDSNNKKKVIADLNDSAEVLNRLTAEDAPKFEPLPNNATEEEIIARQKEIQAFAISYNDYVRTNVAQEQSATTETGTIESIEKVTRDVVEKSRTSTTPLERVESMSINGEAISAEDARQATAYGENGAKLLADTVNNTPDKSFSEIKSDMHVPYMNGWQNKDMSLEDVTDLEREAYYAGAKDRALADIDADERTKNAIVYGEESGVDFNDDHTKPYNRHELKMADTMGKDFGEKISFEDRVMADYNVEANAKHQDGEITISNNSDNKLFEDVLHEVFHRMKEMNTPEVQTLERELFDFADSEGILFENERAKYEQAGMSLDTGKYIEEVVADIVPKLWRNEKAWNKWRERLDANPELRSGWQKLMDFISELIEKARRLLKEGSFSKEARAKVNKDLAELERFRNLYGNAYKATRDAVRAKEAKAEKTDTNSTKNLEIKINEEYNGSKRYSLKGEQYTESEYRKFGWARENNILSAGQNADYRSKFADAKVGRAKFPKSKRGEYIIPVSDIYNSTAEGINNVLVFAKGTIENPIITSVIEVYEYDETNLDRVRRKIYDCERRGIQQKTGELFTRYDASDFELRPNQQRVSTESFGNSGNNGYGERSSGKASPVKEETKVSYSLKEIVDENNKSYGIGVVLDSTLLDNLTPEERAEMVKEYVKEFGGNTFTAYDSNGVAVGIKIAESKKHFKNKSGKNVAVNKDLTSYLGKNETKQEAITLIDELIVSAKYSHSEVAKYSHGWLDNKGKNNWDYWTTYIQDKNKTIWEARLNIANSTNGEKILYDIFPIKKVGQSVTSDKSTTDGSLSQKQKSVKKNFSLKGGISTSELYDTINDAKNGKAKAIEKLSKYAEDGIIRTEAYDALIKKYGAIKTGENPHRDVTVPAKTAKDKKVSKTVRTVLEAEVTPDEAIPTIEKMVEDGVFSYDVYTDKQAINDAEDYLKEHGWLTSYKDWLDAVNNGEVSKELTTTGWALYNNAVNIATTTTSETERKTAMETAITVLDAMVRHQRSAAQALQATRILKKLSPETQLYAVQKSVNALQNELKQKYGKKAPDLNINEELAEQFLTAETEEARLDAEKEIYKDIGRQMPSRFIDKCNAWRYLAMLGNVRTHGRNIFGNTFFAPVVATKNLVATAIESIVAPAVRLSGKEMLRGKKFVFGSKADRKLLKAAWNDYANVADAVSNGGKYNDSAMANKHIDEGRKIFKSKLFAPVEWARKKNSKALEKEDVWFSKPHYAYALAQYCKANNITPEQIQRGKAIAPAREYAIREAQKATYKDTNAFSQFVSSLGRTNTKKNVITKGASAVVEGILPFRKTPANILVRGVEYSPLGLLKGLTYDLVQVGKGEMNAHEAIDNISAGLTGTGLLALGVYLAAEGLIRGHGEDEEKEKAFSEMMGHQAYSLELPNGQSITLDWLAPEALPFFVGVNIWEQTKGSGEEANMSSILNSITNITEPMLEMSCLQGVNDLIEGFGYASSNGTSGLMALLSSATTSYFTQGVPTLFGQAERTGEEERMTTYTEKNNFLTGDMQYTLGKLSAKIPLWDYNQIPYIDAWGRKEASGTKLKRGLNNFLNPAYTSNIETSDMENELLRLYEATGETSVFPERAGKYFTVDGVRKDLTAEEYVRYATLKGEKSYQLVTELVESEAYKKLDDDEKIKAIEEVYDYANQKAKEAISNYKPQKWVETADEFGSNAENYIAFRTNISEYKNTHDDEITKEKYVDFIFDYAESDSEAWLMYLNKYDSKTAIEAEKHGIDAELFMTAVVDMSSIKADYNSNGKAISGSRRAKIERYLNSVCNSYKEYLFLLGTEYDSIKDDHDYVQYFGK